MISTARIQHKVQRNGHLIPKSIDTDQNCMIWIPLPRSSMELTGVLNQWLEHHPQAMDRFLTRQSQIIQKWNQLLDNYIPPYPLRGILLTAEEEQVQVIPLRYPLLRGGIANMTEGWSTLWQDLIFEPVIRIVELLHQHIKVYEVRLTDPELIIDLPIHQQKPRYMILRGCIAHLLREYRKEPGPLVIRGTGDGIMELDCWILSAYFPIQTIWKIGKETNCLSWWQHMNRQGLVKEWIETWTILHKDIADQQGKWIHQENEINNALRKNRLDTILLPRNHSTLHPKKEQIKLIIQSQTTVRIIMADKTSAILK